MGLTRINVSKIRPQGGVPFEQGMEHLPVLVDARTLPYPPLHRFRYIQEQYHEPDFIVDISGFETRKLEAIKAFSTQFYDPNSSEPETPISKSDYLEFVTARMKQFGQAINTKYGEGFTIERTFGIDDLFQLK